MTFNSVLPTTTQPPTRFVARGEPALSELLDDPVMLRLLLSDGVNRDHLMQVISDARNRLSPR